MSEAELHLLRARLRGGMINKARRGELEIRLPIGFVYDAEKNVRLDPDISIQESVRQLFRTFHRTGSARDRKGVSRPKAEVSTPYLSRAEQRRRSLE